MAARDILVTGADGFIGRAVVARLKETGRAVREASRALTGDIGPLTPWGDFVDGVDAIIHCAARAHILRDRADNPLAEFRRVNRDGTIALAQAARAAGVRKFIFVSSIGVNGKMTHGKPFTATDVPKPQSPYAVAKWEAEQALRGIDLATVVVRPPLVIGAGAKGNIGTIATMLKRGIPLPFGAITQNRRDLISRDNLVAALIACLDRSAVDGQVLLVSDGITRSTAEIVRAVAADEGVAARLLPVPPALIGRMLTLAGRGEMRDQLLGDLEVDMSATKALLSWEPHVRAL